MCARKKIQDNKIVTKVLHSIIWGEAPTGPILPKNCVVCDVDDVITCAKLQVENCMGYDFTGGRIYEFRIDFLYGPYNSACSANALPVI